MKLVKNKNRDLLLIIASCNQTFISLKRNLITVTNQLCSKNVKVLKKKRNYQTVSVAMVLALNDSLKALWPFEG